jgi:hypothetical protein
MDEKVGDCAHVRGGGSKLGDVEWGGSLFYDTYVGAVRLARWPGVQHVLYLGTCAAAVAAAVCACCC